MARLANGVVALVVVGGLASLSVLGDEIGAVVFFWVFFGGIAGVVAMLATSGSVAPEVDDREAACFGHKPQRLFSDVDNTDPLVDESGVVRYPGDELDIENFPTPGACGRF